MMIMMMIVRVDYLCLWFPISPSIQGNLYKLTDVRVPSSTHHFIARACVRADTHTHTHTHTHIYIYIVKH